MIDDLLKQADPVNNPVGDQLTVGQLLDKASTNLDSGAGLAEQPEIEAEIRTFIAHAYEYLVIPKKAQPHYARALELKSRMP